MKKPSPRIFIHATQSSIEKSENGTEWKTISHHELENLLKDLKKIKGSRIIYSRENPFYDPAPRVQEVFKEIERARIPVTLARRKGSDGSGELEPDGEASYANCLLVTLAKNPGAAALLEPGYGVPDLGEININPAEKPWILGLPFNYLKLRGQLVIDALLSIPSELSSNVAGKTKYFSARMVLSGNNSALIRFELTWVESGGKKELMVRRAE